MAGCKTDFLCTLLSPSILLKFCSHLNLRDSSHLVLWSTFLVGFFTFFRTANFVPNFLDTFSSHFVLSWGSIMFTSSGALLTITRTKGLASLVSLDPQDFSSQSMLWRRYIHLQVRNSSWTHQTPKRLVIWPLHVVFMLASGGQTFSFKQCFPAVPYRDILWTHIYFVSCYSFSFPSKCSTSQVFVIKILIDCSVYIRHILYNTLYIIFFLPHPLSFPLSFPLW